MIKKDPNSRFKDNVFSIIKVVFFSIRSSQTDIFYRMKFLLSHWIHILLQHCHPEHMFVVVSVQTNTL